MKKKFNLLLGSILFATALTINFQKSENESSFMKVDLHRLYLEATAECELAAIPPYLPAMNCTRIWCPNTYQYGGCGAGDGSVECNERKEC